MNLYVRADLKMRKGKMAAQSAHVTNKLLLEYTTRSGDRLSLDPTTFSQLSAEAILKTCSVVFVNSESELESKESPFSTSIVDHGRTEFNGVKTKTVVFTDMINGRSVEHRYDAHEDYPIFAKQIIVFSKQEPLSKENACVLSGAASFNILLNMFKHNSVNNQYEIDIGGEDQDFKVSPASIAWLKGAFGKISLCVQNDSDLFLLADTLTKNNIKSVVMKKDQNYVLCTEPCFAEQIDPFTKSLKLI